VIVSAAGAVAFVVHALPLPPVDVPLSASEVPA
jgi:hypothetical protein